MRRAIPDSLHLKSRPKWLPPISSVGLAVTGERTRSHEELAREIGVASGNLYFHTRQLLESGLIRLVGTRQKQAITEKLYRAVSRQFLAAPPLDLDSAPSYIGGSVSAMQLYQHTRHEYPDLFPPGRYVTNHSVLLLQPRKAQEILQKLDALVQEAIEYNSADAGAIPMAFTALLYPLPAPNSAAEEHGPVRDTREAVTRLPDEEQGGSEC